MRLAERSDVDGDKVRVITKLTNERSGVTLWSNSYSYDRDAVSKVPRYIAVEAGNQVRCGLFAASTYPKPLPDQAMADYLQSCVALDHARDPSRGLAFARKVVVEAPDFSWGWSSLEIAGLEINLQQSRSRGAQRTPSRSAKCCRHGRSPRSQQQRSALVEKRADRSRRFDWAGSPARTGEEGAAAGLRLRTSRPWLVLERSRSAQRSRRSVRAIDQRAGAQLQFPVRFGPGIVYGWPFG